MLIYFARRASGAFRLCAISLITRHARRAFDGLRRHLCQMCALLRARDVFYAARAMLLRYGAVPLMPRHDVYTISA